MAGTNTGVIGIDHIDGSLSVRKQFGQIWKAAVEKSTLVDPRVCPSIPMTKIRGIIPLMNNLAVQSQLQEFEKAQTENAKFSGVNITLFKDRVRLGVSDEAGINSDLGDPLVLQRPQVAAQLAGNLDALIAAQIYTTPQTQATADWSSVSPLSTLGTAIATLRPYQASAVVMAPTVFAKYVAALGKVAFSGGSTSDLERGIFMLPGYNIPVFSSTHYADQSANGYAVIANDCPGVLLGTGAVKSREWDDPETGAKYWQYDVWRTPISNLRQNASSLNLGIITGCVS